MDLREMLDQQMGLYEEHTDCVVEDGLNGHIFKRHRKTLIDGNNGPVTVGTSTLHKLDCGHVVGSRGPEELLGKCDVCGKWMCFRCGVRCSRCFKLLCPSCTKVREGVQFCGRCRRITLLKLGSVSLLRRIHDGLSE